MTWGSRVLRVLRHFMHERPFVMRGLLQKSSFWGLVFHRYCSFCYGNDFQEDMKQKQEESRRQSYDSSLKLPLHETPSNAILGTTVCCNECSNLWKNYSRRTDLQSRFSRQIKSLERQSSWKRVSFTFWVNNFWTGFWMVSWMISWTEQCMISGENFSRMIKSDKKVDTMHAHWFSKLLARFQEKKKKGTLHDSYVALIWRKISRKPRRAANSGKIECINFWARFQLKVANDEVNNCNSWLVSTPHWNNKLKH